MIKLPASEFIEGGVIDGIPVFGQVRCQKGGHWIAVVDTQTDVFHINCKHPGCGWGEDVRILPYETPDPDALKIEVYDSVFTKDKMV